MAKARRQNTEETEGSARAFAASETAESHEDTDAAQKRKKDETPGVVTRGNPWRSKDLPALPSRQQHLCRWQGCRDEVGGIRNDSVCHRQSGVFPPPPVPASQSCSGGPACLMVTPTSCTSWHPQRPPQVMVLRDVKRKEERNISQTPRFTFFLASDKDRCLW